jgi:MoaA/NifB/PqqE/SkfB family radical SAM enzyme
MSKIITGFAARLVRIRIHIHIVFLATRYFKNPITGLKVLNRIAAKRKTLQGHRKVSKYIKSEGRYFFSDAVPGFPSAAFNGFFLAEIKRESLLPGERPPLSTVFIAVSSKCPLRCKHCYEWNNISGNENLPIESLKEIIRKVKGFGVHHIQLSGGEPLERMADLPFLVHYSGENADVWLNTSGFGLTYEKAVELKKAGLTGAEISLDHWDEDEHNRFRGNKKSFFWVSQAVINCRKAGILTSLSLCATNDFVNPENLAKYAELAIIWEVRFIRILEPRQAGRYKGMNVNLSPSKISVLEDFFLKSDLSETQPEYPAIAYPSFHQRRIGCLGAGNRYLYIDSKGQMHSCPFCQDSAGNAVTDTFEEVVEGMKSSGCLKYETNTIG